MRKKFFGATGEDLPPGGPTQDELDTVRVTHMRGIDATGDWVRDDRRPDAPNHQHFTRWAGVTILLTKGVPRTVGSGREENLKDRPRTEGTQVAGDRIDHDQA